MNTKQQYAWAAGLFEGEGTITRLGVQPSKRWSARISSTDEDVVEKFHQIVRVGNKYGPYGYKDGFKRKRSGHAPYWVWAVSDRNGLLRFAAMVGPWLLSRRTAMFQQAIADVTTLSTKSRRRRFDN